MIDVWASLCLRGERYWHTNGAESMPSKPMNGGETKMKTAISTIRCSLAVGLLAAASGAVLAGTEFSAEVSQRGPERDIRR